MKKKLLLILVACGSMLSVSTSVIAADTMYIPIPSYRVGPYAAGGTGYFGGILDYYNLVNASHKRRKRRQTHLVRVRNRIFRRAWGRVLQALKRSRRRRRVFLTP